MYIPAALAFVTLLLFLLALGICGELRRLEQRRSGIGSELPINSRAPRFSAPVRGSHETFDTLHLRGVAYALLFVSPSCSICRLLLAEMKSLSVESLFVVCRNTDQRCIEFEAKVSGITVLLDNDGQVAERFGALSLPALVLVNESSRIRGYGYPRRYSDIVRLRSNVDQTRSADEEVAQSEAP